MTTVAMTDEQPSVEKPERPLRVECPKVDEVDAEFAGMHERLVRWGQIMSNPRPYWEAWLEPTLLSEKRVWTRDDIADAEILHSWIGQLPPPNRIAINVGYMRDICKRERATRDWQEVNLRLDRIGRELSVRFNRLGRQDDFKALVQRGMKMLMNRESIARSVR